MFGIVLCNDHRDVVTLTTLAAVSPSAIKARYRVGLRNGRRHLFGDVFDSVTVALLRERHIEVVACSAAADDLVIDGLLLAVGVRDVVETEVPAEALFVATAAAAHVVLEHLALLERHDALVGQWPDGAVVVRVARPPWWLLSRVIDGDIAGVRVALAPTSSSTPAPLYVEHSRRHPLAAVLAAALRRSGEIGVLWQSGTLLRNSAWAEQPLLAALQPVLPAHTSTDAVVDVDALPAFLIALRLGADGEQAEPELFVVASAELPRLQALLDSALPDELERIVIARVADAAGRGVYVVRELVRAGQQRLGTRLSSVLSSTGYVKSLACDGLYVPPGRRLVPTVRPAALRGLLGLNGKSEGSSVVVDQDADGLRLLHLPPLQPTPLSSLSSYVLTERRTVYDELFEEAVLSWPGVPLVQAVRPPRVLERVRDAPMPATAQLPTSRTRPQPSHVAVAVAVAVDVEVDQAEAPASVIDDRAALLDREHTLQREVLNTNDAAAWSALAAVKCALGASDVVETVATALFLANTPDPTLVAGLAAAVPGSASLVDLVVASSPTRADAVRLCAGVLQLVAARDAGERGPLDDDIMQHAWSALLRDGVLVPRRLQWVTARTLAQHQRDPIALTRAKQALLGVLNVRGLTEALDMPRFVRTALADSDDAMQPGQSVRSEQLVVLQQAFAHIVPEPGAITDGPTALFKAIFADGLVRVGGPARDVIAAIEAELPAHDVPIQLLLRLYLSRSTFVRTREDATSEDARNVWRHEVQQVLSSASPGDRRVVEWLVKRSAWLRTDVAAEVRSGVRPSLVARVAEAGVAAAGAGFDAGAWIAELRQQPAYDFEIAICVEQLVQLAMHTGRDDVIAAAADEALAAAVQLRILAHRARVLGACVQAAAAAQAKSIVERGLVEVAALAHDKQVPGVRDLLAALRPALQALRRLGEGNAARRFIQAFVPLTTSTEHAGPLAAALAEGCFSIGDAALADQLLERALDRVWAPTAGHIDRFEAGQAVLTALAHDDQGHRFARTDRIARHLRTFTDAFTTSRWYPTHQVLMVESLVDCLADDATRRSDVLQAWLDDDEARLRQRVLLDWRTSRDM
jgi:hypothetical protein